MNDCDLITNELLELAGYFEIASSLFRFLVCKYVVARLLIQLLTHRQAAEQTFRHGS